MILQKHTYALSSVSANVFNMKILYGNGFECLCLVSAILEALDKSDYKLFAK
jgi:hypothetical protein